MNNQTNSNAKPMYTGPAPLTGGYPQGQVQQQAQQNVPYQGMYNGNPGGAYNMPSRMNQQYGYAPSPYNMQYQGGQSSQLGRYVPPTMQPGSAFLQQGLYNSNQWNNTGGYQYNLPNAYGQTGLNYGQGQAPMLGMYPGMYNQGQMYNNGYGMGYGFTPIGQMAGQAQGAFTEQMFSDPSGFNPQDRAFYSQQLQGMFGQNTGPSPMQQTNFGQAGQMMNRQQWQGANSGVGAAPMVDDTAARQAILDKLANDLRQRQWNQVLDGRPNGQVNWRP